MTKKRFPGVIPDGATAAAGGKELKGAKASAVAPNGCGGPTTTIPGQPADYAPFVGPICSEDGKAAIVTAYINAEGEGENILDPVKFWREAIDNPPSGLQVKVTGGAGFSADGIEVFESLNGTLLLAAVSLVDLPPDPDLPLADVLPDPAGLGALRRDPLALDRVRSLRARGHDQRPVELDHVGAGLRRGNRLRAAARRPISRGAPQGDRPPSGDAYGPCLCRAGDLRLGR